MSVLTGGVDAGRALVGHAGVDKIAFTGSTAAGREIGARCGGDLRRCSLELGGKSAAIVLDDADLAGTAQALRFTSFVNNGQACAAQTRILAPRSRYAEAVDAIGALAASLTVGDPHDPAIKVGPLVSRRQRDRVRDYIDTGIADGARLVTGGSEAPDGLSTGWFIRPTVLADVDNRMRVAQEEIFGPVLCVIPYDDDADAVRLANDSRYGLAGSVFTSDPVGAWPWPGRSARGPSASTDTPPIRWPPSGASRRRGSVASGASTASTSTSRSKRSMGSRHERALRRLPGALPDVGARRVPDPQSSPPGAGDVDVGPAGLRADVVHLPGHHR